MILPIGFFSFAVHCTHLSRVLMILQRVRNFFASSLILKYDFVTTEIDCEDGAERWFEAIYHRTVDLI